MPGRGTTDAIFIVRQLQKKYLDKNKNLYFAFIDLEKSFNSIDLEKAFNIVHVKYYGGSII